MITAPGSSAGEAINVIDQIGANSLPIGIGYEWMAIASQQKQIGSQAINYELANDRDVEVRIKAQE